MIPKPPRQEVNVTRMIIYSLIPILSIYAGWRIEKFWILVGINFLVGFALGVPLQLIVQEPYGSIISFPISIAISIYVVRHFARKYNDEIRETS